MSLLACALAEVPSWTDKAQAIAAIIAIPGAIAAFYLLFKKDREKEEAVRQLAQQTTHLGEQTAHLERQAENLGRINEALVGVLTGQKEQATVALAIRKNQIRPFLRFASILGATATKWNCMVENKGGLAQKVVPRQAENQTWLAKSEDMVAAGGHLRVVVQSQTGLLPTPVEFYLHYEDEDHNPYRQYCSSDGKTLYLGSPEVLDYKYGLS